MQQTGPSRVRETFKVCSIIAVTAVLVALALPTAVEATSHFMKIEDADSTIKAQVDNGKVRVGDGVGHPDSLTVNGAVTARPQVTSEYRRFYVAALGHGTCDTLATAPAGKAIVLQSLAFSMYHNPSPGTGDWFALYATPDCGAGTVNYITPPGLGLIDVPLDPGVVSTTGFSIYTAGDQQATVHGVGYLIAAATAPPAAAEPEVASDDPRARQ